jgi:hypothetical protein
MATTATRQDVLNGKLTLTLLCMARFMIVLDLSIINIALPSIQRELAFSTTALQQVVSIYSLFYRQYNRHQQ